MKRKLGIFIMALCLFLGMPQAADTVWASTGTTSVSVSSGNVNIGDTVTVTVKASGPSGEKANATMTLTYDANVLQFVSCNATYGGGGGSVIATGDTYTVTLKAVAAGTSALSVSGSDGVIFDTLEEMDSMSGSSASVTVNNAAGTNTSGGTSGGDNTSGGGNTSGGSSTGNENGGDTAGTSEKQSADNSLKSLTISPGTLSPAFSGKTTTYSATVGSDVSSIAVSATPANEKATVESVTGNTNLKAGSNTVKIVVKAENGVTATYTINVTKQGESTAADPEPKDGEETPEEPTEETVTVNGAAYRIAEDFAAEDIPTDFTENTINYHGTDYKGVSYDKGAVTLFWLMPADAAEASGQFFVYDATRDSFYPFVKLVHGDRYVIALLAPIDYTMPENYQQTELSVAEGGSITAYQVTAEEETELVSDFYTFYAINSDGTEGWYQYDALEQTFQRVNISVSEDEAASGSEEMSYLQEQYAELSEEYANERSFARNVIGILVFVIAVLVIVIINLLLHRAGRKDDDDFGGDGYDEEDMEPEEKRKSGIFGGKLFGSRKDDLEADDDILDEEEDMQGGEADVTGEEPEENLFFRKRTERPAARPDAETEGPEENLFFRERAERPAARPDAETEGPEENLFFRERAGSPEKPEKTVRPGSQEKPEKTARPEKKDKPKTETTKEKELEVIDFNDL